MCITLQINCFNVSSFVLSGPAAAVCAETLRQEGFRGPIRIATKEKHLPYDRPKLSKVGIGLLKHVICKHLCDAAVKNITTTFSSSTSHL